MRGVFPVCAHRASTPSLADRQMPYRFFCIYRVCNRAQTIICYKWKEQKRYARFSSKQSCDLLENPPLGCIAIQSRNLWLDISYGILSFFHVYKPI